MTGERPTAIIAIVMVDVTEVEYLNGFRLHVRFSYGSEGVHDFS